MDNDLATRIEKHHDIDLGGGYYLKFFSWEPDRDIKANARRYFGIPNVEKIGAHITCPHGNAGGIMFKQDDPRYSSEVFLSDVWWDLISWEPLHVEPSIQFLSPPCCHGFIREGKWVNA